MAVAIEGCVPVPVKVRRRFTASPARQSPQARSRIEKSANQTATDLGSKSDQQNQFRLMATRGRRTVRAGTGERAS